MERAGQRGAGDQLDGWGSVHVLIERWGVEDEEVPQPRDGSQ